MKFSKVAAMFGCTVLLFTSIVGCSSGNNKEKAESVPGNEQSSKPMELEAWVSNEQIKSDAYFFQEIEKAFDVKINVEMRGTGAQDYIDKLNVQISSGDVPDWINDQAITVNMFDNYVKQGVLAEIPVDMIKENMPNYMEWVQKYDNIFQGSAFSLFQRDGKNYTIPVAYPDLAQFCVMYYRQDWLDGIGAKVPETLPELEEVLVKFKDKYNAGYLGITSDPTWAFSPIYGAYGIYPGMWTEKDGKIVRGEVEPQMKDALTLLNKWYKMGLIDPEWVTLDFDRAINKVVSSKVGVTWQNIYAGQEETGAYAPLKNIDAQAEWAQALGPKGPNGDSGIMQFNPIPGVGIMFGKHMEKDPEKMKKYLQIFDQVNTDMSWLEKRAYGEEGTHFKKENGEYAWLSPYDKPDERQKVGIVPEIRFPSLESPFYDTEKETLLTFPTNVEREYKQNAQAAASGKYDILALFPKPKWEEVSEKLTTLTNKAIIDFISGKRPISEFDDYVAEWKKQGGDKALQEAQNIYDTAFKK
ncbi:extracellular solute-binding protein [Paenibacillus sp. MBLB2552]|uniref:Extracellular solute-binding protein n=1 Tax=Paenibacillus mellifer TaxID=2937794 RepID=A0A9X2BU61_9BACL|nr:extracellular solute-binding protein [Paenibacillus mellifer]MCK8488721.1 extracellular solute-binding protein [Paenibacillus mellifer]